MSGALSATTVANPLASRVDALLLDAGVTDFVQWCDSGNVYGTYRKRVTDDLLEGDLHQWEGSVCASSSHVSYTAFQSTPSSALVCLSKVLHGQYS